jgi:hypothetical protein
MAIGKSDLLSFSNNHRRRGGDIRGAERKKVMKGHLPIQAQINLPHLGDGESGGGRHYETMGTIKAPAHLYLLTLNKKKENRRIIYEFLAGGLLHTFVVDVVSH